MFSLFFTPTPYIFYGILLAFFVVYGISFEDKFYKKYPSLSIIICFALLLFARLPFIFSNFPFNPDESMQLAQAITIKKNPIVFEAWDGNTIGPLCTYLIMIPHALGLPLEYTTLHLMSVVFQFLFVAITFNAIKIGLGVQSAFWSTLPLIVWFAFTQHYDFVHYTSELPALVLLSICNYIYFLIIKSSQFSLKWLYLQGFLAMFIPFGKLQAVPLIFIILLFTIIQVYIYNKEQFRRFFQSVLILCLGCFTALFIISSLTFYWEVFDEMLLFYFKGNLFHEAGGAKISIWRRIINHFEYTQDLFEFKALIVYLISFIFLYFMKINPKNNPSTTYLWYSISLLIFAIFAISKSGFRLYHYYHFVFLPISILIGYLSSKVKLKRATTQAATVSTILLFLLPIIPNMVQGKDFFMFAYPSRNLEVSNVSKAIKKYANQGEYLAVWGWMQNYFVETQMPQATNDNHTIRCFTYSLVKEHRSRFIADLKRNKPKVFVDAVAPNSFLMKNKEEYGIQKFPELEAYLSANYIKVETVDGNDIYLKKQ